MSKYRERLQKTREDNLKKVDAITNVPVSYTIQDHNIGSELFGYAFTHKGQAQSVNLVAEGIHLDGKDPNIETILVHYKVRKNTEERHPTKLKAGMNVFGTINVASGDRIVIGTFSPAGVAGKIDRIWVTFNYAMEGVQ